MLDLKYIINQIDTVKKGMEKRHATIDFSSLFENEEKKKKNCYWKSNSCAIKET